MIIFREIDELVEKIKENPQETEIYKIECGNRLKEYTSKRVKSAILTMLYSLYQGQMRKLKRDIARCILTGGRDAEPSERISLLQCLFGTLSLLFENDFSAITDMCEQELERRVIYDEGIEDSEEEELL